MRRQVLITELGIPPHFRSKISSMVPDQSDSKNTVAGSYSKAKSRFASLNRPSKGLPQITPDVPMPPSYSSHNR